MNGLIFSLVLNFGVSSPFSLAPLPLGGPHGPENLPGIDMLRAEASWR